MTFNYPWMKNNNKHLHVSRRIKLLSQSSSPESCLFCEVTFHLGATKCQFCLTWLRLLKKLQAYGLYSLESCFLSALSRCITCKLSVLAWSTVWQPTLWFWCQPNCFLYILCSLQTRNMFLFLYWQYKNNVFRLYTVNIIHRTFKSILMVFLFPSCRTSTRR